MDLIASLPEIELHPESIFVMHKKCEKFAPFHKHSKSQLTYVEGGLAYLRFREKLLVIPARHYFWIPAGIEHTLTIGHAETRCRTLFFHINGDEQNEFYTRMGIYPINDLLFQMIRFTEQWNGHILPTDKRFSFLHSIKNILPQLSSQPLSVALPFTENERMLKILTYLEDHLAKNHTLHSISIKFGISERSLSRFFQSTLSVSFLQYLKLLRMAKAFQLIVTNEHSLADVAFLCGYQSLSSFSNTFYQVTKTRPSAHLAGIEAALV
ncbi:AraC family transcriptional regulator [Mucilaginibacter sabulilitoris]|uniref:AraC family transcriptional regulator n=1 Tax=Mucilaginibacter sabulilitoris TaxID=1173583 RepID=A0ABZ0TEF4_9SPHI|nr:AraC family transcriptional regulator [Mucilaginibacter sabulilitoris]WPU91574.1 AraC family transcriptional regulator [Mucilaginibacter sabulilitoris]